MIKMKKTKPKELNLDLLIAIGTIFTLLIVLSTWVTTHIELKSKLEVATSKAQQAEATIQELSTTNLSLHSSLISLNKSYDELEAKANYFQKLSGLKEDLRSYSLEDQASAYALGWTETEWDYYAKHSSDAEGICGVMPLWNPYLQELNIKPNSLEACIAIFNFYKEQTGSTPKAIKEYKGVESKKHMWIVAHTLYIRQYILKKLKESE